MQKLLAEGRITLGQMKRLLRLERQRVKRREDVRRRNERDHRRYARARRNAWRFEERTGIEVTGPASDECGNFLYWGFNRNAVKVWGRR